jgi:hypothetical protein
VTVRDGQIRPGQLLASGQRTGALAWASPVSPRARKWVAPVQSRPRAPLAFRDVGVSNWDVQGATRKWAVPGAPLDRWALEFALCHGALQAVVGRHLSSCCPFPFCPALLTAVGLHYTILSRYHVYRNPAHKTCTGTATFSSSATAILCPQQRQLLCKITELLYRL